MRWITLRSFGNSRAVQLSVLFPLIGYLILFNDEVARFLSMGALNRPGTRLNFFEVRWKAKLYFVYFGLMALGIGSAIYQIRCPFIIKKHADAADYVRVDGDTMSDAQISVIAHIVRTQHDTSAPLDEHRADVMRRWYRENSMAHPISRYAVSVHFIAGTAILAIPSILAAIKIIALGLRRL